MITPDDGSHAVHKRSAAERAVELVASGMVVGLGTGSTARFAIQRIGTLLRERVIGDLVGVPTSVASELEARRQGIPLAAPDWAGPIDLTIDGADEVSPTLDLIKGAGGALLREKIVAEASDRLVIVVDQSKQSAVLGTQGPVPVEVLPFGWRSHVRYLESLGASVRPRSGDDQTPYLTDQGNMILDCAFGPIHDPGTLATALASRAGILGHGLFLGLATDVVMAGDAGVIQTIRE